jgi:hypothetical protein
MPIWWWMKIPGAFDAVVAAGSRLIVESLQGLVRADGQRFGGETLLSSTAATGRLLVAGPCARTATSTGWPEAVAASRLVADALSTATLFPEEVEQPAGG